jgi:hypothetical protein
MIRRLLSRNVVYFYFAFFALLFWFDNAVCVNTKNQKRANWMCFICKKLNAIFRHKGQTKGKQRAGWMCFVFNGLTAIFETKGQTKTLPAGANWMYLICKDLTAFFRFKGQAESQEQKEK